MVKQKKNESNNYEEEWVVEKVIGKRINNKDEIEYQLKWEGWPKATWEPESHLSCPKLIAEFEAREAAKSAAISEEKKTVTRKSKYVEKLAASVKNENRRTGTRTSLNRQSNDTFTSSDRSSSRKRKPSLETGVRPTSSSDSRNCEDHRFEPEVKYEESSSLSSSSCKKQRSDELSNLMRSPWDRGLEPEEIQGANQEDGRLKFNMKWKNSAEPQMVLASEANLRCPQIVIDFYEKNLAWQPSSRKK